MLTLILTLYRMFSFGTTCYRTDVRVRSGFQQLDIVIHPLGTLSLHAWCGVCVGTEGEGGSGMAQILLHGFDIVSSAKTVDRISVPKRVETKVTQTDPAGDPFEVHVEGLVLDEAAEFIGEDQVVCVVPG